MDEVNLYESRVLRDFTGAVIRPGGFQLTHRGLAYCALEPGARVLDLGCGTGAAVNYLRYEHGLAAMGIDRSSTLLEDGVRVHCDAPLAQGHAEQLPLGDGSFEAVLCECVLSLCPDPLHVLGEARRVLQLGGYLVLTDVYSRGPNAPARPGKTSVNCCLQGAVRRSIVEDRIAAAGYDLMVWEDHSVLLWQLAAQLVWTYGSLDAFWSAVSGPDAAGVPGSGGAAGCRRPGYYLLVAQKPANF